MKSAVQCIAIVLLLAMYAAAGWAVLHPHVSPEYRAYFIDRTSTDYRPQHYSSTPQQGMIFRDPGLPDWVASTHGFSFREEVGRWTDENLHAVPGLTFTKPFGGDVCLELNAYTVPWLASYDMPIRFGDQQEAVKLLAGGPDKYEVQFHDLRGGDHVDFILPPNLPAIVEREHTSGDTRRLGVSLNSLRILPGRCT
jgi:hypothetical protein